MFRVGKTKKSQEGDERLIEQICDATWEPLYRYVYFKVQNREEAEDITQEAYVKALSYFQEKAVWPDNHIAFLKTVALNVLRDRWRKSKRHGLKVNPDYINPSEVAVQDPAEVHTQRILIEDALKKLGEEQRKVIELRILNGYSTAETARMMDKKETAVRVLQYRALQTLANILTYDD